MCIDFQKKPISTFRLVVTSVHLLSFIFYQSCFHGAHGSPSHRCTLQYVRARARGNDRQGTKTKMAAVGKGIEDYGHLCADRTGAWYDCKSGERLYEDFPYSFTYSLLYMF